MHRKLFEITGIVDRASKELLSAYDAKQLYAFRVASRRIRSILKHIGSHRARHFRKTWGGFAAVTNSSRDWDVFLTTAEMLLNDEEYRDFRTLNLERVSSSHDAVIKMLKSDHWRHHHEEWIRCLERSEDRSGGMGQDETALNQALSAARRALAHALAVDDDRAWHKFRIAVKEVRYVADAGKDDPERTEYLVTVIETCKMLQTMLGNWHDTVVQLNLLEELDAAPVHDKLKEIIQLRKHQFLDQLRELLEEQELFVPEAAPVQ